MWPILSNHWLLLGRVMTPGPRIQSEIVPHQIPGNLVPVNTECFKPQHVYFWAQLWGKFLKNSWLLILLVAPALIIEEPVTWSSIFIKYLLRSSIFMIMNIKCYDHHYRWPSNFVFRKLVTNRPFQLLNILWSRCFKVSDHQAKRIQGQMHIQE